MPCVHSFPPLGTGVIYVCSSCGWHWIWENRFREEKCRESFSLHQFRLDKTLESWNFISECGNNLNLFQIPMSRIKISSHFAIRRVGRRSSESIRMCCHNENRREHWAFLLKYSLLFSNWRRSCACFRLSFLIHRTLGSLHCESFTIADTCLLPTSRGF